MKKQSFQDHKADPTTGNLAKVDMVVIPQQTKTVQEQKPQSYQHT